MIRNEVMPEQTAQLRTAAPCAEMELLLCCARTRSNPEMSERIRDAARKEINWFQFIQLALRHDILSLGYRNLHRFCRDIVPSGVLQPLRARLDAEAAEARQLAKELVDILGFLDSCGIPAVPFKGP